MGGGTLIPTSDPIKGHQTTPHYDRLVLLVPKKTLSTLAMHCMLGYKVLLFTA